jgi:hypothetical protein
MAVNMDRQIIGVTTETLKKLWPDSQPFRRWKASAGQAISNARPPTNTNLNG